MAVVGNTTAILATSSYTPPFQTFTNTVPITYAGGPQTTTTGRASPGATATQSSGPVNPTVPASADDHTYIANYLQVHGLSAPSYRYAYFLWFILIALVVLYSLLHHVGAGRSALGAWWSKALMRRRVWRQGKQQSASASAAGGPLGKKRRPKVLPSNAQIASIAVIGALSAALCVVGADYIAAGSSTWDLGSSFTKRAAASNLALPNYNISKTWWTSGSRFGLIAFALMPLVVLFALKAPPFALLALRAFTHLHADKLALLHRWTGRIVWLFTTLHVALWTVELFKDSRNDGTGRSVWNVAWLYSKFIWAVVGYAGMTGLIVLSIKSIRKRVYELFYILHVVLTIVTLVGSLLHYPPLWYWITIAAALWAGERAYRLVRFGFINGWFGGLDRQVPFAAGPKFEEDFGNRQSAFEEYSMRDLDRPPAAAAYHDKSLPPNPFGNREGAYAPPHTAYAPVMHRSDTDERLGSSSSHTHVSELAYASAATGGLRDSQYSQTHDRASSPAPPSSVTMVRNPTTAVRARPLNIPPGYAHAQLLPSKTVRLTIRVPRPFHWYPGQHVLLYIPEISRWQSHPFSILSVHDDEIEREIVLLVKARKGFTLKLFEATRRKVFRAEGVDFDKRQSLKSIGSLANRQEPPNVLFRAMVDGPFGSAARGKPGVHSSNIIICGGSGVSFGIAVLQYLCECMSTRDAGGLGRGGKGGRYFITRRVRFIWIVREFAEIAWISVMIKRCIDLVPRDALQIDIFVTDQNLVTNGTNLNSMYSGGGGGVGVGDDFLPPQPSFARSGGHSRRGSSDSVSSQMSVDSSSELAYLDNTNPSYADGHTSENDSIIDLTNYEDEEDPEQSEVQLELSKKLRKEGKVRRMRTRRGQRGTSRSESAKMSYPPSRPPTGHEQQGFYDASRPTTPMGGASTMDQQILAYRQQGGGPQDPYDPYVHPRPASHADSFSAAPPNLPYASAAHSQRASISNSFIENSYDRYDPFASGARSGNYSPSPSMQTFDIGGHGDTKSIAGDSLAAFAPRALGQRADSMVLIGNGADGGADAGIWLDAVDFASMNVVAEFTRPGRPKLDVILKEEMERAQGSIGVGSESRAQHCFVVRILIFFAPPCLSLRTTLAQRTGTKHGL